MLVPSFVLLVGLLLDLAVLVTRGHSGVIAAICAVKAFLWASVFAFVVIPTYGSKLVAAVVSISPLVVKQTSEPMPLVVAVENRGASQVCFFFVLAHLSPRPVFSLPRSVAQCLTPFSSSTFSLPRCIRSFFL
jgi:hypothetical protein